MYFDFEDYRPDVNPVGRAISWREGILISIIVHLVVMLLLVTWPRLFPFNPEAARTVEMARDQSADDQTRFVFVQPRVDTPAPRPPDRAEASDLDRQARTPERAPELENPLPLSRGNTPERVESAPSAENAGTPEPEPPKQAGETQEAQGDKLPDDTQARLRMPSTAAPDRPIGERDGRAAPSLGDALRNLQRYVGGSEQFDNPKGGGGAYGPAIQFDTKGVEFGPWIRRFIAQVKGNWLIPYASLLSMSGHVVITFNVHKSGALTDLTVVGPSEVDAFNNAAFGALAASNPTIPLPPEYPSDRAFFTVTFFYNETPP